jgi:hypothetical protein
MEGCGGVAGRNKQPLPTRHVAAVLGKHTACCEEHVTADWCG